MKFSLLYVEIISLANLPPPNPIKVNAQLFVKKKKKKSQMYVSLKIILTIILRNVPLVILIQVLFSSYLEIHQIETKNVYLD